MVSKLFLFRTITTVAVSTIAAAIFYTYPQTMIVAFLTSHNNRTDFAQTMRDNSLTSYNNSSDSIPSFLSAVRHGHWVRFQPSTEKLEELTSFPTHIRHTVYALPRSLQRPDAKCGNTTISSTNMASRKFRALCDPAGPTPCCYDNQCVNTTVSQCACAQCVDARTDDLHADFAHYVMSDTGHQLTPFTSHRAICDVMSNTTLLFYGDSLTSHVYLALLTKTLGGNMTRLFSPHTPEAEKQKCQGQRMYVMTCRQWMKDVWKFPGCDAPGKMSAVLTYRDVNKQHLRDSVQRLVKTPNSVLYVGIGLHQDFDISYVNSTVVQTILEVKGESRWPYVIYAGNHHWGILRNPDFVTTKEAAVEKFNQELQALLSQYGMTYFDTYEMTRKVFSYDGTHYAYGVNQVKADILLNVIHRLKHEPVS